MKRVLLVNSNTLTVPYPVPPLGLCLLAEALKERYEVQVYDGTFQGGGPLPEVVAGFEPHYIGMGVRNVDDLMMHAPTLYVDEIAQNFVRPLRQATAAPLVLGGSGFSLLPRPLMELLDGDYGVVGGGEEPMLQLLEALDQGASGADLSTIPGVLVRDVGASWLGPVPPARRCDTGPGNVHRWIDFTPYRQRGSYPLQTRRGCAHRCVYCTYPLLEGRRLRPRDPQDVADEIQRAASDLGPGVTYEFVDSTFNTPPGQAQAVCREIASRGLVDLRLRTMGVNPAGADRALFALMKEAGFAQIDITPDSASPKVLRALGKGFTLDDLRRSAAAVKAEGMPCMWFFLLGGPGEDEQTLRQTLDFIDRDVHPEDMVYMAAGLRIYPGTPLHSLALEQGIVQREDDLLQPRFFVSPELEPRRLLTWVEEQCARRPNCLPAWETRPSPELMERALTLRAEQGLDEPMFRTLIRLQREFSM